MTKPLTIEQIKAAFDIVSERVQRPKQVRKIERLMNNEILLTFTDEHCMCIDEASMREEMKHE